MRFMPRTAGGSCSKRAGDGISFSQAMIDVCNHTHTHACTHFKLRICTHHTVNTETHSLAHISYSKPWQLSILSG